jgi:hypothetical protein
LSVRESGKQPASQTMEPRSLNCIQVLKSENNKIWLLALQIILKFINRHPDQDRDIFTVQHIVYIYKVL